MHLRQCGPILAVSTLAACGFDPGNAPDTSIHAVVGTGVSGSKSIGPAGGSLCTEEACLSVPPGALASAALITITSRTGRPPWIDFSLSPAFDFQPASLEFALPATVTLPFLSNGRGVAILWARDDGSSPELLPTMAPKNTAQGDVTHLGVAVVADQAEGLRVVVSQAIGRRDASVAVAPNGPASNPDTIGAPGSDATGPNCNLAPAEVASCFFAQGIRCSSDDAGGGCDCEGACGGCSFVLRCGTFGSATGCACAEPGGAPVFQARAVVGLCANPAGLAAAAMETCTGLVGR